MAEPDEMEEDLFADLYDADENTNNASANTATSAEPVALEKTAYEVKEEPGYGEEPDTAAPPVSFEDYNGNNDEDYGEDHTLVTDIPAQTYAHAAPATRDEPLQMKEDG